jgi:predicted permease
VADHPLWIRALVRLASARAAEAEIGDAVEEYDAGGRSPFWLVTQVVSIIRRRRSPLTVPERGAEMLANIWTDVRYALRTLGRNPGFAVAAVVPIALGIGINTGVFALLNSVAWRPLPVPDSDALVSIHQEFRGGPRRTVYGARALFSLAEYHAYRDETRTLSGLLAYSRWWTVTLGRESPRSIDGIVVTCNYFDVLNVAPVIGTGFTPANCDAPDAAPAVMLSHALWQDGFGANPRVLETPIVINGREVTVVGVAPKGFDGIDMARTSFFAPITMARVLRPEANLDERANVSWLTMIGRLRTDADIVQARADLSLVAQHIDQQQPGRTTSLVVAPAAALSLPVQRRGVLTGAAVVLPAFGLVLLIAAANVANLMLARGTARRKEIAIRLSVGATRRRLIQQLLTESAIIAIAGAVCGTLLFSWSLDALIPWLLASVPSAELLRIDAKPDRLVLAFALGLTAIAALAFGVVPALNASGRQVHGALKSDSAGSTVGRGWIRGTLIGAQVAACTTLLIPAGLLSRALYAAYTFDAGFEYRNVAAISLDLRGPQYETGNAAIFHQQWLSRVGALPGVEAVARTSRLPLSPGRSQTTFRMDGSTAEQVVDVNHVSPEFFAVLSMPLVGGRVFTADEPDVVLVTESTARRYWPGQDAIGRSITMDRVRRQIVGIVRDARVSQVPEAISSYMYLPAARGSHSARHVLARSPLDVATLAAAIRAETSRMDPSLIVNVQPLSDNVGQLQTLSRIAAGVAGGLSALALALAALGVYGVVAYVVSRRLREVGVRMALGAGAQDVQQLILRQTLRPVVIGMVIGVGIAAGVVHVLRAVLFGVSPYDPAAFVGAPAIMLVIAAAAALIPTRRAMRVDPMSVLRSE